jgi:hypothetical protein
MAIAKREHKDKILMRRRGFLIFHDLIVDNGLIFWVSSFKNLDIFPVQL